MLFTNFRDTRIVFVFESAAHLNRKYLHSSSLVDSRCQSKTSLYIVSLTCVEGASIYIVLFESTDSSKRFTTLHIHTPIEEAAIPSSANHSHTHTHTQGTAIRSNLEFSIFHKDASICSRRRRDQTADLLCLLNHSPKRERFSKEGVDQLI